MKSGRSSTAGRASALSTSRTLRFRDLGLMVWDAIEALGSIGLRDSIGVLGFGLAGC